MRPIFTIHAGEFLAADYIERNYAKDGLRVWVPSKDDGIDLLVTSNDCRHAVSLQVKFSKNFGRNRDCDASGWWLINRNKIRTSKADYWVFVLPKSFGKKMFSDCCYILIRPKELLRRMDKIHHTTDKNGNYNTYFTVKDNVVIETRGVRPSEIAQQLRDPHGTRDFSKFLGAWDFVLRCLLAKKRVLKTAVRHK